MFLKVEVDYLMPFQAGVNRTVVGNCYVSGSRPTSLAWNLPRLPLLPVSPDLIYFGQAW